MAGEDGVQVWEYERTTAGAGITVNTLWADVNISRLGECRAVFEISSGEVTRLAFTRVTGRASAPLAACVPLVQECVDMMARTIAEPVTAEDPALRPGPGWEPVP